MMPEDGLTQLRRFEASTGAVAFPGCPTIALLLWGLLIPIRREFQQYVNLRPGAPATRGALALAGAGPATSTC